MVLKELEQFLDDCIKSGIPFPKNTMTVVVDDFYKSVPEEYHNLKNLEFKRHSVNEIAMVIIIPPAR